MLWRATLLFQVAADTGTRRNHDAVYLVKDKTVLILNGPGMADLAVSDDRSSDVTLKQVQDESAELCAELGMGLEFRQTDDQDEMSRWIAKDSDRFDALIINPVGDAQSGTVDFDRYRSAIEMMAHRKKPVIEVHLTNIFRPGEDPAKPLQGPEGEMGFICGLGLHSYLLAIRAVAKRLHG